MWDPYVILYILSATNQRQQGSLSRGVAGGGFAGRGVTGERGTTDPASVEVATVARRPHGGARTA